MASTTEPQVAPETARDGSDTRNKDLDVACDDTQEWAYEEEVLGDCASCQKPATTVFWHLHNGPFELCDGCFAWADHEDDYGETFGQTCADCQEERATRTFCHLRNGEFMLCEGCFVAAEQEDSYGENFGK